MTKLRKILHTPIGALMVNLFTVIVLYTITRLVFVACNGVIFADHLSAGYLMQLLSAGLIFDASAIAYLNSWMLLMFLVPLHWKEASHTYYTVARWLFVIINFIGLAANLCDCAYYPFTGRRTTWNVLQEFSNEGNFLTIIWNESMAYWYLFIVAAIVLWMLWRLFRYPQKRRITGTKAYATYYSIQTIVLAVAVVLAIGCMRGGLSHAVRPITISNANQYINNTADAGIVLNTPFSIIRTIGKKPFVECNYMSAEEAETLYSPVHQPADSTTFRAMNVVVVILESFGREAMDRGYMPFLTELSHKGLSFEYSYAAGRKSIDGMPSILSSIPSFIEPFFLTPASMNDVSGLARELTEHKGYSSAFFHGAENGSMGFEAYAKATGFQQYYGRTEYNNDPRYHGDDDFDGTWAIWDEEFLQFYCDKMTEMNEPFMTSVFTASSHTPFVVPERYRKQFPVTDPKIWGCIRYSDNALRLFFEKAQKQPWFQNTIFVFTADHTNSSVGAEYITDLGNYKIPIVIYSPSLSQLAHYDKEHVVSQTDIMPTVLGLLGYDRPYIAFGQDILNTKPEESFVVNYITGNGYYQYLQGDWMLQFDGNEVVHAYRFKTDTLQKHDLKAQCPKRYEQRLKSIIQQYMYRMNHNKLMEK